MERGNGLKIIDWMKKIIEEQFLEIIIQIKFPKVLPLTFKKSDTLSLGTNIPPTLFKQSFFGTSQVSSSVICFLPSQCY